MPEDLRNQKTRAKPIVATADLDPEDVLRQEDIEDRRMARAIRAEDIADRKLRRKLVALTVMAGLLICVALAAYAVSSGRMVFLTPIAPGLAGAAALAARRSDRPKHGGESAPEGEGPE